MLQQASLHVASKFTGALLGNMCGPRGDVCFPCGFSPWSFYTHHASHPHKTAHRTRLHHLNRLLHPSHTPQQMLDSGRSLSEEVRVRLSAEASCAGQAAALAAAEERSWQARCAWMYARMHACRHLGMFVD